MGGVEVVGWIGTDVGRLSQFWESCDSFPDELFETSNLMVFRALLPLTLTITLEYFILNLHGEKAQIGRVSKLDQNAPIKN